MGNFRLKLVIAVLLVGCIGFIYRTELTGETVYTSSADEMHLQLLTIDKEILLRHLYQLQKELKEKCNDDKNVKLQIEKIIAILEDRTEQVLKKRAEKWTSKDLPADILEVCPEVWLGTRSDYPFYYQGWRQENCSNVLPFEKVITVLLFQPVKNKSCPLMIQNVLSGLRKLYPRLQVIIGGVSNTCLSTNETLNTKVMPYKRNKSTSGMIWNQLIKLVTTPYVLIGRNLDDFIWTTNLERQVRMLSYNANLSAAGGAVRNSTGHWRVGCFQTTMRNYILTYLEGYYASRNECMFCDYLVGPFVTRTKLLQSIKFDEKLPIDVVFEDWFWRIQQKSHTVVNCPDVMYLASDPTAASKFENRTLWIPFIRKWLLNRVVVPSGLVFSYTCVEAGISCKHIKSFTRSFLIPICCLEQYAYAFKVFHDFCLKNNLRYELDGGSVLGALKTNGFLPWDIDGDNTVYTSNHSFFKNAIPYFKNLNVTLGCFHMHENQKSYFCLETPDILVQMWGLGELSHDNVTFGEPFRVIPTQVFYHGYWVYGPHSPGTYSRNRYGIEVLRHSHSWTHLGLESSWSTYSPGKFNNCTEPGRHACSNLFAGDGNIQFHVPN